MGREDCTWCWLKIAEPLIVSLHLERLRLVPRGGDKSAKLKNVM